MGMRACVCACVGIARIVRASERRGGVGERLDTAASTLQVLCAHFVARLHTRRCAVHHGIMLPGSACLCAEYHGIVLTKVHMT